MARVLSRTPLWLLRSAVLALLLAQAACQVSLSAPARTACVGALR